MGMLNVKNKLREMLDDKKEEKAYQIKAGKHVLYAMFEDDVAWAKRVLETRVKVTEVPRPEKRFRYELYVPPSNGFCKLLYSDTKEAMDYFMKHFGGDEWELKEDGKVIDYREDWYS
jgi:hypothetical protein